MLNHLMSGWNIMRILRLAMGAYALWEGFRTMQVVLIIAGFLLALMALMNVGCCGTTCYSQPITRSKKPTDANNQPTEITFEEVK